MNNELDRRVLLGAAGLAGVAALSAAAKGGPLTPPAGAVAATGKTLTDVEPRTPLGAANTPGDADSVFRISSPGSYYLTGNLSYGPGFNGIKVASSGVVIDLNGFQIGTLGGSAAITAGAGGLERITVRNGSIFGAAGNGVSLGGVPCVTVENVSLQLCSPSPINVGDSARVEGCTVLGGGVNTIPTAGINAGAESVILRCVVRGFTGNNGAASCGIAVRLGSVAESCAVEGSASTGFYVSGGVVRGCGATGCARGFFSELGGLAESCNASDNSGDGFSVSFGTVRGCSAKNNGRNGFSAGIYGVIEGCTADNNATAGTAGDANIRAGDHCRVVGNSASRGPIGFRATSGQNFFAGNTAINNTQEWNIAANNACLVVTVPASVAFTGDNGGVSPGSSNPWANFTM